MNDSLARQVFGSAEAALGQRLGFGQDKPRDIQIVGVVRDVRSMQVRQPPSRAIYRPVAQEFDYLWSLEVRAHGDPTPLADLVRRTVRETHPALSSPNIRTLSDHVERSLRLDLLLATLSTGFGVMALFLVCLGLYGVISQWVGQRTREIGVRMALGATAPGLRWLVLRQAFVLVVAGMGVGLPAALGAAQLAEGIAVRRAGRASTHVGGGGAGDVRRRHGGGVPAGAPGLAGGSDAGPAGGVAAALGREHSGCACWT